MKPYAAHLFAQAVAQSYASLTVKDTPPTVECTRCGAKVTDYDTTRDGDVQCLDCFNDPNLDDYLYDFSQED